MNVRHPPGRGGRLWLEHRLAVATSGADLLDRKRRALVQEHRRLRVLARETQTAWATAAGEAATWVNRAAVIAGDEKLAMLASVHPRADVTIRWRSSMGVAFASDARVDLGPAPPAVAGGSAASDLAIPAARRAVEAAVNDAVARSALQRIGAELTLTARRQRALERRWLPALNAAATRLSETLDELEREESVRTLWATRRTRGSRS
ncbi:MAG TPA: V-type ATP synthase subunit D [Candidatus Dormibacteraeota bacterium]|nr:V-type ATP synthase subunit D [Candidatus Dormibacteraeota bacterium]